MGDITDQEGTVEAARWEVEAIQMDSGSGINPAAIPGLIAAYQAAIVAYRSAVDRLSRLMSRTSALEAVVSNKRETYVTSLDLYNAAVAEMLRRNKILTDCVSQMK